MKSYSKVTCGDDKLARWRSLSMWLNMVLWDAQKKYPVLVAMIEELTKAIWFMLSRKALELFRLKLQAVSIS
ncbi:uncharacterized protein METZ01_LOCUS268961 [marine metagenome]|jgi:hypothetical protein|uniref:Uncharacterized protein n=1 Tax=marine metagenome TaxID=408172 RepID=A0A382JYW3_9ZZZZ